jgi:hypothetical protein
MDGSTNMRSIKKRFLADGDKQKDQNETLWWVPFVYQTSRGITTMKPLPKVWHANQPTNQSDELLAYRYAPRLYHLTPAKMDSFWPTLARRASIVCFTPTSSMRHSAPHSPSFPIPPFRCHLPSFHAAPLFFFLN